MIVAVSFMDQSDTVRQQESDPASLTHGGRLDRVSASFSESVSKLLA